jgi:hypothetical protein
VYVASRYRILHVADPHFSRCHFVSGKPSEIGWRHALELEQQLKKHQLYSGLFDALVLSGDFTFACQPDGFEAAVVFIEHISRLVRPRGILVVPGNHDMDLSQPVTFKDLGAPGPGDLSLPTPKEEAEKPFRDFLKRIEAYVGPPNEQLSMVVRAKHRGLRGLTIVGLNSSRVERRDAQGWGYVGIDQVYEIGGQLNGPVSAGGAEEGDLIMAVAHHNLLPIWDLGLQVLFSVPNRRKFSFVMDAASTLNFLADLGASVILHGHTHVQSYKMVEGYGSNVERQGFPTLVLGTGSLGLAQERTDPPHHFQILEIDDRTLLYQDLSCIYHQRDASRTWQATRMRPAGRFFSLWSSLRAANTLKLHQAASFTAAYDSETMSSWSLLRDKRVAAKWLATLGKIGEMVRTIRPAATDKDVEMALDDVLKNPPSEYDLSNFNLPQMLVRRMNGRMP